MVARGERWEEGIVRRFGMDMYTLLYLKWLTHKDLLDSMGDSAPCYVAAWMGGVFGVECWLLSHVQVFVAPRTVAGQAPLSMEFFRQEYWNGSPFPSPGDLPDPGIKPMSPVSLALQVYSLPSEPPEKQNGAEWIHIHVWLSRSAFCLKLSQHW